MVDKDCTYMIMLEIDISEDAAGMMDRQFSGLETEKVEIEGNDHNRGWLKALNDGKHGNQDISMLLTIIDNRYNVTLVPMDHHLVKVEPIKKE